MSTEEQFVTFRTFMQAIDAHILKTKLESEGIPCFLFDENTVTMNPLFYNLSVGGIKLKIRPDDLEAAEEVMRQIENTAYSTEEGKEVSCPACGSVNLTIHNVPRKGRKSVVATLAALILGSPYNPVTDQVYSCKSCGNEFNKDQAL